MNRTLSVLLLFSFFALVTPRNWWHHCHHQKEYSTTSSNVQMKDGSFDLCDFELGSFTVHSYYFYRSIKPILTSVISVEILDKESCSFTYFTLRGPPQIA